MESNNTLEIVMWGVAGIVTAGMVAVLVIGWFKGMLWEQQLKRKHR